MERGCSSYGLREFMETLNSLNSSRLRSQNPFDFQIQKKKKKTELTLIIWKRQTLTHSTVTGTWKLKDRYVDLRLENQREKKSWFLLMGEKIYIHIYIINNSKKKIVSLLLSLLLWRFLQSTIKLQETISKNYFQFFSFGKDERERTEADALK